MKTPAIKNRDLIKQDGEIIGLCLGNSFYGHFIKDNKEFVNKFNKFRDAFSYYEFLPYDTLSIQTKRDIQKQYKDDMKFLKKLSKECKDSLYTEYSNYVLRPHVGYYEEDIVIDNNASKKTLALVSGNYKVIAFEGLASLGCTRNQIHASMQEGKIAEYDLFDTSSYAGSLFLVSHKMLAQFNEESDQLILLLEENLAKEVQPLITHSLKNGQLALVYKAFGRDALSLVFLDKLFNSYLKNSVSGVYTSIPDSTIEFAKHMDLF